MSASIMGSPSFDRWLESTAISRSMAGEPLTRPSTLERPGELPLHTLRISLPPGDILSAIPTFPGTFSEVNALLALCKS